MEKDRKQKLIDDKKGYHSIWLFIIFYIISFGLYQFYWIYKKWEFLKRKNFIVSRDDFKDKKYTGDISPILRTFGLIIPIYNLFLLYDLYEWLTIYATINNVETELSGFYLLTTHIALSLLIMLYLPYLYFLVSIPLIQVQDLLNKVSKKDTKTD
jgi:hypothetical protein